MKSFAKISILFSLCLIIFSGCDLLAPPTDVEQPTESTYVDEVIPEIPEPPEGVEPMDITDEATEDTDTIEIQEVFDEEEFVPEEPPEEDPAEETDHDPELPDTEAIDEYDQDSKSDLLIMTGADDISDCDTLETQDLKDLCILKFKSPTAITGGGEDEEEFLPEEDSGLPPWTDPIDDFEELEDVPETE